MIDEDDGKVDTEIFGRHVRLHPRTLHHLAELEECGTITLRLASSDEVDGACEFSVYRMTLNPREIYLLVDGLLYDKELPDDIESLYHGGCPWRYKELRGREAERWDLHLRSIDGIPEVVLAYEEEDCSHAQARGLMVGAPSGDGVTASEWLWCPDCGAVKSKEATVWGLPGAAAAARNDDSRGS